MEISERARAGLHAAIKWNPHVAKELLHKLRSQPEYAFHGEQDRYGPLGFLLTAPQMIHVANDIHIMKKSQPFPQEHLSDCEIFTQEWQQHKFNTQELADEIESVLAHIQPAPLVNIKSDPNKTLVFTAKGTYLSDKLLDVGIEGAIRVDDGN